MTPESFDPDKIFHEGEIAVQERDGARDAVKRFGDRMVRPFMPDQHREFFEMLPFIVIGLLDDGGRPWITLATGKPGFMRSPDEHTLKIGSIPLLAGELGCAPGTGDKIGLLGIELPTRRRNRMNGYITETRADGMTVHVDQSFGACPKYIQTREVRWRGGAVTGPAPTVRSHSISSEARRIIERVDTFFISSRTTEVDDDPRSGVDASHRGGRPGFVRVIDDHVVAFPDFVGNRIFNTLGNIQADGRVGMIFTDFETGDAVFLTGSAEIIWDEERVGKFAGAQRLIEARAQEVVVARSVLPLTGDLIEAWPRLDETGIWDEAEAGSR